MPDKHLDAAIAKVNRVEATVCLSSKVIVITEDQLELRIQDGMQKLSARDSWIAPLSILLMCLVTLSTADFKNFSWIASGTLKGLFIAVTAASVVWFLVSLFRIKSFGRGEFMASVRAAGSPYSAVVGGTTEENGLKMAVLSLVRCSAGSAANFCRSRSRAREPVAPCAVR
jgi:hypothetical protein